MRVHMTFQVGVGANPTANLAITEVTLEIGVARRQGVARLVTSTAEKRIMFFNGVTTFQFKMQQATYLLEDSSSSRILILLAILSNPKRSDPRPLAGTLNSISFSLGGRAFCFFCTGLFGAGVG